MQWWMSRLVDVGLEGGGRAGDQVGIACRVDHHLGEHGVATLLALEDRALDDIALQDRGGGPGVQQQARLGLGHHLHGERLEGFRVDRRRPGDDAMEGRRALCPVGRRSGVLGAPVGPLGSLNRLLGQAVHQVLGEPTDNVPTRPVRHAVDPDDEAAGGEAAQVIVALDQQDVGAQAGGSDGRSRPGRTAADDQNVGLGEHRDLAGGLHIGLGGSRAPGRRGRAAEGLEALLGTDAGAVVARSPGAVLEDFRLVKAASALIGALVVRHALVPVPLLPCGCG